MASWSEVVLGQALQIKHGFAFKGEFFDPSGACVLLTPKNFLPSGGLQVGEDRNKRYSGPVTSNYVLERGDIVLAMTDLKADAPILGAAGVVPAGQSFLHNQRIGKIVVRDPTILDAAFVPWLLNSPGIRQRVRATATGSTVRHTAPSRIEGITARVPPITAQRHIAAVLSAFDELIEINQRRIELLENLVRSLYREWFVQFRCPRGQDAELVAPRHGETPSDWTVRSVEEIASFQRTSTKPKDHPTREYEHFSIPAYDNDQLPNFEPGDSIKSSKYVVDQESILLSKLNPRFRRVWFARPQTDHAIASTEFLIWRGSKVPNSWLWALFMDDDFRNTVVGSAGGTSTSHQRFKPSDISSHRVAVAPDALIGEFDSIAAPGLSQAATLRQLNRQLAATRDLLLPRLVTGRLDISDLDLGSLTPAEVD